MNLNGTKLERITIDSKSKLENLISIYLHDLSEFANDLKINNEGKFEYDNLDLYFKSQDLTPYFITYQGEVAGFILFNSGKYVPKHIDYVINELFILKSFRKKGIASAAIKILLDNYKGNYRIVQISSNKKAVNFWMKFYEKQGIEYVESEEKYDELEGNIQIFNV